MKTGTPDIRSVKIKLGELQRIQASLEKILTRDLPIRVSHRLAKLAKNAMRELKVIEETRQKLIKKLGEKVNDKGDIEVRAKRQEFVSTMEELMEEEVEIEYIPIDLNTLGDIKLSGMDVANIEPFIDESTIEAFLEEEDKPPKKVLPMKIDKSPNAGQQADAGK